MLVLRPGATGDTKPRPRAGQVRRYVDLAEDSLEACLGTATIEIVR